MKESFGKRWAIRVGKQAVKYRWAPWIMVFAAVAQMAPAGVEVLGIFTQGSLLSDVMLRDGLRTSAMIVAYFFFLALLFLVLAGLFFERRQFYLIIEDQKQKIAELEEQLLSQAEKP